jgi:hypothetical protein
MRLSNAITKNANKSHINPLGFTKAGLRDRVINISPTPKINDAENRPKSKNISVALTNSKTIKVC